MSSPPTPKRTLGSPQIMTFQAPLPQMNTWEAHALNYATAETSKVHDALIYPGIYSASGFDLMTILLHLRARPHPVIELGPVDCSVAIVLCDLEAPDTPIIYASDAFCQLTGYSRHEVLGRNCRFLQKPRKSSHKAEKTDKHSIQRMRQAVHGGQEIQLQVSNFKRNGKRFTNILSIIPLQIGPNGNWYSVGLLSEVE